MFPPVPEHLKSDATNPFEGSVPNWSYSRLSNYLKCPYSVLLSSQGHRGEPHPAAVRGIAIHEEAEKYILGELPDLPKSLEKFIHEFENLRTLCSQGEAFAEDKWAWKHDWSMCGFDDEDRWGRGIVDAFVQESPTSVRVIDFKSGRNQGVEVSHGRQILYYALAAMFRNPEVESITTELWYIDHGTTTEKTFTVSQLNQFLPEFTRRALDMTEATMFMPKSSRYACQWCDHKKSGLCEYAAS